MFNVVNMDDKNDIVVLMKNKKNLLDLILIK